MEGIVVDMDVDVMFLYLFNQKMRRMSGGRMKLLLESRGSGNGRWTSFGRDGRQERWEKQNGRRQWT
jgi:hypothetical protein